MLHSIVAQVQPDISTEAKFLQYAVFLLITAVGILFYLCRDSWLSRINEAVTYAKQVIDIQQKNYELLVGLKSSIDASNKATENLITVLSNTQNADLKKQIKDLEDQKKGVS